MSDAHGHDALAKPAAHAEDHGHAGDQPKKKEGGAKHHKANPHGGHDSHGQDAHASEKHPIFEKYVTTFHAAAEVESKVRKVLNKFQDQNTNEVLDQIVNELYPKEAEKSDFYSAIKSHVMPGVDYESAQALYGVPKHLLKKIIAGYETINDNLITQIAGQHAARVVAENTRSLPVQITNMAYDGHADEAKKIIAEIHGLLGEPAKKNKEIDLTEAVDPDRILEHAQGLGDIYHQIKQLTPRMKNPFSQYAKASHHGDVHSAGDHGQGPAHGHSAGHAPDPHKAHYHGPAKKADKHDAHAGHH